jgi:hypothetical protein
MLNIHTNNAYLFDTHIHVQELGPKEETLMRATEKLHETDREYVICICMNVY